MNQRLVAIGVLLLLLIPFAVAHGEQSFWNKYAWYIISGGILLFLYGLYKVAKKLVIVGIMVAAAVIVGNILVETQKPEIGMVGEIHHHADFKVYLNGVPYNFSQEKYQSKSNNSLSNFAHLHDMNGNIIHKHAQGVTLGFFFETLGMKLNSTCLVLDDETSYCNKGDKEWKMYVHEKHNDEFEGYDIQDEDKILLSYGHETGEEIQEQINAVTDEACIYSLTCPEKGMPPEEATCIGETCTVEG